MCCLSSPARIFTQALSCRDHRTFAGFRAIVGDVSERLTTMKAEQPAMLTPLDFQEFADTSLLAVQGDLTCFGPTTPTRFGDTDNQSPEGAWTATDHALGLPAPETALSINPPDFPGRRLLSRPKGLRGDRPGFWFWPSNCSRGAGITARAGVSDARFCLLKTPPIEKSGSKTGSRNSRKFSRSASAGFR